MFRPQYLSIYNRGDIVDNTNMIVYNKYILTPGDNGTQNLNTCRRYLSYFVLEQRARVIHRDTQRGSLARWRGNGETPE